LEAVSSSYLGSELEVNRVKFSVVGFAFAVAVGGFLSGCSSLPSQGPMAGEVLSGANSLDGLPRYAVIDLNERVLSILARYAGPSLLGRFGDHRSSPEPVIGVGDQVSVTIWEAAAGGLFSAPAFGGVTAGSHSALIPPQVVQRDGRITVPYADKVRAAGLTTKQVEREIINNLAGKAIEPQALVNVTQPMSTAVTVTGEVTAGARVPISPRGDRILDVIANAGGVKAPVHEIFITLNRGNSTATVPMQALLNDPRQNIYVRPNDVITLVRNPQWFSAFGATGRNFVINFDAMGMTLAEAIAKAGGLLDSGADPDGVFLLRPEPAAVVRQLDPAYPIEPGQTTVNVVYHANMRDANTYFIARNFKMHHQDILYVAGAAANQLQKALTVLNSATGSVYNVAVTKAELSVK
jgi:polysaccharide export outer membrane protein